jgi:hypothetical protein
MGIQLIHDEHPLPFGIGFHGSMHMGHKILLRASVPYRRAEDLSRRHLEVGDQRLGSVPDIFKLLGFRLTGLHRTGRMEPFQSLDAGFLIGADQVDSLFMEFLRLVVQFADRPYLAWKSDRVFHFVVQPIPTPMGF